jgi:heme exporter protein C
MNARTPSSTIPWSPPDPGRWPWFGAFAIAFLIAGQVLGLTGSPADRDMGDLEKIIYVHVPAAWVMSVTFAVVMFFSLRYLWKHDERDDLAAAAAAEFGTVLNGLTLVIGMIFAKPTFGVWWAWDARLTSTLVLFLIFIGYLSLRGFVDDPERRAQWSAAVGILGAINVGIVYMSVRWWRTLHQMQSTPNTVDATYVLALRINAFAFLFLMIYFVRRRYESLCLVRAADHAAEAAALRGA